MRWMTRIVLALGAWAACNAAASAETPGAGGKEQPARAEAGQVLKVTVDREAVACRSFMGFGAEWDPGFWREWNARPGVTEGDWEVVVRRIRWMRLPIVRMMMQVKWCRDDRGRFDWDRTEMKNVYRYLDVCQKQGITVLLTDWGCQPQWLRVADIPDVADPKYAAAIGTYMDHLLRRKGYTCIKYFIMANEPNLEVRDFGLWKKGVEQVMAELRRRGLDKKVVFTGSDESGNEAWHRDAVAQVRGILGAYDIHRYAPAQEVRSGRLLDFYAGQWQYALKNDPAARRKPMIVGEAGIYSEGFSAEHNPLHLEYKYGLHMADYAAQAAGAGSWAVLAWMLDDSSHANFTWGMWKNKKGGLALKPWFYPWALLCRTVPAGSKVYSLPQDKDLRVLAASAADGRRETWSFCLVNRADHPKTVRLRVPGAGAMTFKHYLYSQQRAAADSDGMPVPLQSRPGNLADGLELTCPGNAVHFLTSVGGD